MLRLLTLLLLASAQLKVRYTFNKIYGTKVIDLSGNGYHAVKNAPGGSSMINTPSGLYLAKQAMYFPSGTSAPSASTFTVSVLMRIFKSTSSQRGLYYVSNIFLLNPSGATMTEPSQYVCVAYLSPSISIYTSAVYPHEVWVFVASSVEYDTSSNTSTLKLFVNDAQVGVATGTGQLAPTTYNYLNDSNTDAIYYEFRYYWGALSLSDMKGTLFEMGAACSDSVDACLPGGSGLCKSNDAYHFDINCAACTMTNYACRDQVTTYEAVPGCTEGVANPDGSCVYPTYDTDFCPSGCGACTSSSACLECDATCQTCNFSVCLTCKSHSASPQAQVCTCNSGFYDSDRSTSQSCLPCSSECTTCDAPSTCLSCADSQAEPIIGVCFCRDGFYDADLSSTLSCLPCSSKCSTCDVASACLTCADTEAELNNGVCTCRDGFYDDDASAFMRCLRCDSQCASCIEVAKCLTCADQQAQPLDRGCKCKSGFYDADPSTSLSCRPCSSQCSMCDEAKFCLSCVDPNADLNLGCICKEGTVLGPTGACVTCPDGQFSSRQSCEVCHSDCRTCTTYPSCTSCKDPDTVPSPEGCRSCEEGSFLEDAKCEVCPWLCTSCSKEACFTCIDNAIMDKGKCSCKEGYLMDAEGCSAKPAVSFTLSVSEDNILSLFFNTTLSRAQTEVEVSFDGVQDFNFTIEANATEWQLLLGQSVTFKDGSECTVTLSLAETCPYVLTNPSASVKLFKSVVANSAEQKEANSVSAYTQLAATIAVLASLSLGLISGNPSAAWSLMSSTQLLQYIPMMDIDFPLAVRAYLKASADFNPLPNLFSYFAAEEGAVPACAQRQGLDSSDFLENAGQLLTTFVLSLLCLPLLCLLGLLSRCFIRVAFEYRWNFFSRFIIQATVELQVAAFVQLFSTTLAPLSTVLSCVALAVCLAALPFFTFIIFKDASKLNDDSVIVNRWATLFEEFKNNRGWKSSCFYVVFLVRRLLYVSLLFTDASQPLVQVIVSAALSVGVAVYLLLYLPFKEPLLNFCRIYSELCNFLIFIFCGFFLLDLTSTSQSYLKWVVLCCGYSITLAGFLVSIFLSIRKLIEKYKSWKSKAITIIQG